MTAGKFTRGLIATSGIVLLLSGAAVAQTTTTPPATDRANPPATSTLPPTAQQAPRPLPSPSPLAREDVSKIIGSSVYSTDDRKIGAVSTVLMQPDSKQITKIVVAEGGVLGIGAHYVALPLDEFAWDFAKGVFKVSYSSEEVKAMPEWKEQITQLPAQ